MTAAAMIMQNYGASSDVAQKRGARIAQDLRVTA